MGRGWLLGTLCCHLLRTEATAYPCRGFEPAFYASVKGEARGVADRHELQDERGVRADSSSVLPSLCLSAFTGSLDLRGHTRGNILGGGNHSQCVGAALFPSSARWPRLAPLLLDLALEPPCDSGDRLPIALFYGPSLDAPQSQSCCQRLYNFLKKF